MDEKGYVILSATAYESVLNYLSENHLYKDVASLIHNVVTDANNNIKTLRITNFTPEPVNEVDDKLIYEQHDNAQG